ncbi:transferrin-binding protein-like solute binding protein [Ollibium composti]|uniref:Transferrin-binding protein-like solute binding protein n=1 Tax=Ollibium composti TaxID=2675109 RepID=A0ABY2Q6T3_9HYPH|nr:transferrin-binding protein-like solute binding protein [Mesorhizobium composti]THF55973.1 transferrin-binding protein-like solute binding protein [Mesorhizobium composti]
MNPFKTSKLLVCVAAPLALAGCGGGSGGPGGPGGPGGALGFTKFPIQAGKTTTIKGNGREAAYTVDQQGFALAPFGASSAVQADVETDADGDIASVSLKTGTTSKTWNGSNADLAYAGNGKLVIGEAKDGSAAIGFADPDANGFSYQTYGAWMTEGASGGKVGAFSMGAETAAADIPSSSTAKFKGTAGGIYANAAGPDVMTADTALDVDFGAKTAQFSTTNTTLQNGGPDANLDMSGNLAIAAGGLSGNVTTADNSMTGTADGRFYGPGAEEVGGTFELRGANGAMAGAYGAVK